MQDPKTGRCILGELKPMSCIYEKFADNLPTDGEMILPSPTVCKTCKLVLSDGTWREVIREHRYDNYRSGILFSTQCDKCDNTIFFTINPTNTSCKLKNPETNEEISLELKEEDY